VFVSVGAGYVLDRDVWFHAAFGGFLCDVQTRTWVRPAPFMMGTGRELLLRGLREAEHTLIRPVRSEARDLHIPVTLRVTVWKHYVRLIIDTTWNIWSIFLFLDTCFSVAAVRFNECFAVCSEVRYCEWPFHSLSVSCVSTSGVPRNCVWWVGVQQM
jgi:hypothetical protein